MVSEPSNIKKSTEEIHIRVRMYKLELIRVRVRMYKLELIRVRVRMYKLELKLDLEIKQFTYN